MPEIVLKNVTKRWGDFVAVDNLNMTIEDRDFITLLGPSGCGKTTTLRMIAGLETPTEGTITIGGRTVFDSERGINISPDKRDIGFLFQNYALWPHMTVYQNISFGLENMKWKKADIKARVAEMLKLLKIEEFSSRYPAELSGGQQQRVAIARTLAPAPKVLFMDEPLSNLDAKLRSEMRTELKRLHADTDATFLYVTHDQLEAMTLATKICLIDKGHLQQYEPPLKVYRRPKNLFVADFVGNPTMNLIPAKAKLLNTKEVSLQLLGLSVLLRSDEEIELVSEDTIVGIRPESLPISDTGRVSAMAYSTLPAGMETTVKIAIDGQILSSVVFGAIDYGVDEPIKFDFSGDGICLFDKSSGNRIAIGSIEVK